jgi:hypothetical protein
MAKNSENDELLNDLDETWGESELTSKKLSDHEIETFYTKETFRVLYQTNNFFLPQIRQLIDEKEIINIRPEYQRRLRWTNKQKSLLIESLLLNIPIPPVYLYESELARYEVMDGQQRLNAVREFLSNDFKLASLSQLAPLNGRTFSKCPPKIQKGLERSTLSAIVLLFESDDQKRDQLFIRRYVFERLNTGGQKLNPQEIRNAIYGGNFNDLIIRLARTDLFTQIWGIPKYTETDNNEYYENPERQRNTLYKTMGDCQIVLRFFALLDEKYIKGSMRSILDGCMQRHLKSPDSDLGNLEQRYNTTLKFALDLFGSSPFHIRIPEGERDRASVGLYDAIMVALDRNAANKQRLLTRKAKARTLLQTELSDPKVYEEIVGRANTAAAVIKKIERIDNILAKATT